MRPKALLWLEQFQRRKRNWNWHSRTPSRAPRASSATTSGSAWHNSACRPASLRAFLQMLVGSMTKGLPTALGSRTAGQGVTQKGWRWDGSGWRRGRPAPLNPQPRTDKPPHPNTPPLREIEVILSGSLTIPCLCPLLTRV
jgi:hypothetical protein